MEDIRYPRQLLDWYSHEAETGNCIGLTSWSEGGGGGGGEGEEEEESLQLFITFRKKLFNCVLHFRPYVVTKSMVHSLRCKVGSYSPDEDRFFYAVWMLISLFTKSRHRNPSWSSWIQSTRLQYVWYSIILQCTPSLPSDLLPPAFSTKIVYVLLNSPTPAACSAHLVLYLIL